MTATAKRYIPPKNARILIVGKQSSSCTDSKNLAIPSIFFDKYGNALSTPK